MTGAAYAGAPAFEAPAPRLTAWRLILAGASVFLLLVYSQAWVFPLMGEQATAEQGGLIRALYLPAYAAGFLLLAVSPGATFQVTISASVRPSAPARATPSASWRRPSSGPSPRTRPCAGSSPPIARRSAAWSWPRG